MCLLFNHPLRKVKIDASSACCLSILNIFGDMSKRVCHITTVHPTSDVRIFHKECLTLKEAGYEVIFLAANAQSEQVNGVDIIGVDIPYKGRIERMRKVPKVLFQKALEVDCEVYHFHDPEFLKYGLKLHRAGKKVVYDVHEDVPRQILAKYWIPKVLRSVISRRFERMENRVASQLDYLVVATPFIRDRFLKINPNTIDVNNFPKLKELADVTPFDSKENAICYVGGMTAVRGIRELVRAMDGQSFTCNLAGSFSPESLETELKQEAGWSQVKHHGFLDRAGVKQVLAKSKVGVVTLHPTINYKDALPVKMFEYMAAGIPVLASDFPLWRQIVSTADCGVCVDPLDPKAIAAAAADLLKDDVRSAQLGLNGRKAVEERYNWGIEAEKLLDVYRQLTS